MAYGIWDMAYGIWENMGPQHDWASQNLTEFCNLLFNWKSARPGLFSAARTRDLSQHSLLIRHSGHFWPQAIPRNPVR
jgi:hypothetical protein